jgi:methylmalonyl-CoA/ethylmalonyl-CoA epimerase
MKRVEHIGIAVKSLNASVPLYEALLGCPHYKTEEVAGEKVKTAFFQQGDTKIELLESTDPQGVIARFIAQRGEGLHHIALEVSDIKEEMKRLSADGFTILGAEPKMGADNKWICFLHPKSTGGVLVELTQEHKPV